MDIQSTQNLIESHESQKEVQNRVEDAERDSTPTEDVRNLYHFGDGLEEGSAVAQQPR